MAPSHPEQRPRMQKKLLCPSRSTRETYWKYGEYSVWHAEYMIVTVFVHIRDACPTSLSHSDWPRSEVMADAVSTCWVSFRSSSSIHLCYRRKPQVSVEPPRQTCQIAACLAGIMWLQRSRGSWVCYSGECRFFFFLYLCVLLCNIWSVADILWKRFFEYWYCIIWLFVRDYCN